MESSASLLYGLGARLGFAVEVTWGRDLHLLDALFVVNEASTSLSKSRVPTFHGLARHAGLSTSGAANSPLMADVARSVVHLCAPSEQRAPHLCPPLAVGP